jgi:hypothetical protein
MDETGQEAWKMRRRDRPDPKGRFYCEGWNSRLRRLLREGNSAGNAVEERLVESR